MQDSTLSSGTLLISLTFVCLPQITFLMYSNRVLYFLNERGYTEKIDSL